MKRFSLFLICQDLQNLPHFFQIDSAMALTSLNSVYLSNSINRFFPMNGKVTVNATLEMMANPYTRSTVVKRDIQRKLIQVKMIWI